MSERSNQETKMVKVEATLESSDNMRVVRSRRLETKARGPRLVVGSRCWKKKRRTSLTSLLLGTHWSGGFTKSFVIGTRIRGGCVTQGWQDTLMDEVKYIVKDTTEESVVSNCSTWCEVGYRRSKANIGFSLENLGIAVGRL